MMLRNLKQIQQNFVKEMTDASEGKKTSLPFIINPLPSHPLVQDGEIFQVIVVGGTTGKVAHVKKENEKIITLSYEEKKQPVFNTVDVFLRYLDEQLHVDTKVIALDFAFPLSPILEDGILDGILVRGTKEHLFKGLVGKPVGQTIQKYFYKHRKQTIQVSCANDTICLLLSGLTRYPKDTLACGILGTGINAAFFLGDKKAVNLESANFDKFTQSEEGKAIDAKSVHPGGSLFEKETTGGYLYKHFNAIIKKRHIKFKPLTSTLELKNISLEHLPEVSQIANELLDRSAAYISVQLSAITEFKGKDMVFVMDGSFFWEKSYKKRVDAILPKLTQYKIDLVEIENSPILGAAQLVT